MISSRSYAISVLIKQFKELCNKCGEIYSAELVDNNAFEWNIIFRGPPNTLYENGFFKVNFKFPEDFPDHPPLMRFQNQMWHPNIFPDGRVCISVLHPNDDKNLDPEERVSERWRSNITVEQILEAVIAMLSSPNPSSPANIEADVQYKYDPRGYEEKVKHLTLKTLEGL